MNALAYLTIVNIPSNEWLAEIETTRRTIGRSDQSDIRVPPAFCDVSRIHAEIHCQADRILIRDLGSRSGTRVNGITIRPSTDFDVCSGDRIQLAGVELRLNREAPKSSQFTLLQDMNDDDSIYSIEFEEPTHEQKLILTLSRAEQEVVICMGRGDFDDESIGRKLFRSPNTVRTHVGNILRKLGLHSRKEIISYLKRIPAN